MAAKATESKFIKKLRKKLKKQISKEQSKLNAQAIEQMSEVIKKLIDRYKEERIDLTKKTISLFDQNRNSAKEGRATQKIRDIVKKDYFLQ